MNKDLKYIKNHYGENFSHLCRKLFPTILDQPGELPRILDSKFPHYKFLYDDLIKNGAKDNFFYLIYNEFGGEKSLKEKSNKTPYELLDNVGYNLYKCESEDDIQRFKKYYALHEELCTFRGGRLEECYVYFAVKKDVDNIKREDFSNPERQDLYGTSVISIQFHKDYSHTLSIKNRYNHTVNNPDATFNNNLDNIVRGLTSSFEKELGFEIEYGDEYFELKNYVLANDGKYYRYYLEDYNIYYCANNVILVDFEPIVLDNGYLLVDNCIVNFHEKTFKRYDTRWYYEENALENSINSIGEISKIDRYKDENNNTILKIYIEDKRIPIKIILDKYGNIIGYSNIYVKAIDSDFLERNETLDYLYIPNCETIANSFLMKNKKIKKLYLPNVIYIGSSFLASNEIIDDIYLPKVKVIGSYFLNENKKLIKLSLPRLEIVNEFFMFENKCLESLYAPRLISINPNFLISNTKMEELTLESVTQIDNFMTSNKNMKKLILPKCKYIGYMVLTSDCELQELYAPNIEEIDELFLEYTLSKPILYLKRDRLNLRNFYFNDDIFQLKFIDDNISNIKPVEEKTYTRILKR